MAKGLRLQIDAAKGEMLANEIVKVRCWLTGFHAGRGGNGLIPGEDSLRQIHMLLREATRGGDATNQ